MELSDYERDLDDITLNPDDILNRWYNSGESFVFRENLSEEARLKTQIALAIQLNLGVRCHHLQLVVCGSAHLGFSPVPGERFGKKFDSTVSDIDVAVVSAELFDQWWDELQNSRMHSEARKRISQDMFWGFINPANVPTGSHIGNSWWKIFEAIKTPRAKNVRGRLYRSYWAMQNYHKLAIIDARKDRLGLK